MTGRRAGGRRAVWACVLVVTVIAAVSASCSTSATSPSSDDRHGDAALGVAAARTSRAEYPGVARTGGTTPLSRYRGPLVISSPGTVVENVEIVAPQVRVRADGVTFRNVRFVYSGGRNEKISMVTIDPRYRGTTFENCEIDGRNATARGILGTSGVTVRGCDIHNVGNGIEIQSDFVADGNYIHDIFTPAGLPWHADGIQAANAAPENVRVVNNTILLTGDETGAVNIMSTSGVARHVVVANNLVGGGGWTLYVGAVRAESFVVANNAFTTEIFPRVGRYGAWYPGSRNVDAYGNFVLGSGAAVTPP